MTVFEGMVNPTSTIFGGVPSPDSVRPGIRPDASDDLREEPRLKKSMQGMSPDELFDKWLERSRFIAQEARTVAEKHKTPAALARLAHAELVVRNTGAAEAAALDALEYLAAAREQEQQAWVDMSAAASAAWVLILCGKSDLAESRLSMLPADLPLSVMRAELAADSDKPRSALELLEGRESPEADSLRGYIYLKMNKPARALAELRRAYRLGDADAAVCANLAAAFWTVGSRRKAINFARQAAKLAPAHHDISLMLLDYLIFSSKLDTAQKELRDILNRGVGETAELAMRRAQIAYARDKPEIAISVLRHAESLASAAGNKAMAAESSARATLLRRARGELSKAEALRKVRTLMADVPGSIPLAYIFADLCDRARFAPELRRLYEELSKHSQGPNLLPIEVRLAYLEGRFDELIPLVSTWSRYQPLDSNPADMEMLLKMYTSADRQGAAATANSLLKRFPWDARIANNAAYVFVLAGRTQKAELALSGVKASSRLPDFVLLATKGLIEIAKQDIQAGLRMYRRAADAADRSPEGMQARLLVTIYQGLVLRLIGRYSAVADVATRAAALPPVALPSDWKDIPELNMLAWICQQIGCKWPPMLP